jgi:hypothetical protein
MGNPAESSPQSSHDQVRSYIETTPAAQATAENGRIDPMTLDKDINASKRAGDTETIEPTTVTIAGKHQVLDGANESVEQRPPLPPRPSLLQTTNRPVAPASGGRSSILQAKATTAVSSVDIETLTFPDGSRGTFTAPGSRTLSGSVSELSAGQQTPSRRVSHNCSEIDDTASIMSYAPTLKANGDLASLLDEGLNSQSPAWKLLSSQAETVNPFETAEIEDRSLMNFEHEFDDIEAVDANSGNEGWLDSLRFFDELR